MRKNFSKYGDVVTFDITYNVIRDTLARINSNGEKKLIKWGMGLFLGFNNVNKAVPFGLVVVNC